MKGLIYATRHKPSQIRCYYILLHRSAGQSFSHMCAMSINLNKLFGRPTVKPPYAVHTFLDHPYTADDSGNPGSSKTGQQGQFEF